MGGRRSHLSGSARTCPLPVHTRRPTLIVIFAEITERSGAGHSRRDDERHVRIVDSGRRRRRRLSCTHAFASSDERVSKFVHRSRVTG